MKILMPVCMSLALLYLLPANACAKDAPPGKGLEEIPDPELNTMRGRYTVGGNAVAWFGVSMISTWRTADGQVLEGRLALGMDFSKRGAPQLSFTPTVSITAADAQLPVSDGRSVDGAGLSNVSGLTQSIQLAGNANSARNVLHLNVRDDGVIPDPQGTAQTGSMSAGSGAAGAHVGVDASNASVRLTIDGQGSVQQWMRSGSVGQSIQLMADGQQASNRMQIDLVRQSMAANVPLTQSVAQAITSARGLGGVAGQ